MKIKVDFGDWEDEWVATAVYEDGEISFSGPKAKYLEEMMENERYCLDWKEGRVWYSMQENPKDLMLNLYRIYTGSALRASRPIISKV